MNEERNYDLEYHSICRGICELAGRKLVGSSFMAGFSCAVPDTNVVEDIPHWVVQQLSSLRAREVPEGLAEEAARYRVVLEAIAQDTDSAHGLVAAEALTPPEQAESAPKEPPHA